MPINFFGDIALTGNLFNSHNIDEKFSELYSKININNTGFGNLEVPIYKEYCDLNPLKNFHLFSSERETRSILRNLNIKVLSLANNHIYDCTNEGIKHTIGILDELGIKFTGAGLEREHILPVFTVVDGKKIGFIAYVDTKVNPKIPPDSSVYINMYDEDAILNDIRTLKNQCDLIVLSLHWGKEFSYYPTRYQYSVSRKFIDAGANFIMGHHTHTFQPFDLYNKCYIFYSLGNISHGDWTEKGNQKSLPRKTKKTFVVEYAPVNNYVKLLPFKIYRDNFIKSNSVIHITYNIRNKLSYKIVSNNVLRKIIEFKEDFCDKIVNYFFGYYKNPFRELVKIFSNIHKIRTLINEHKTEEYQI